MAKKKMIRQLILPFTFILTLSLVVLTWYSFSSMKTFYIKETQENLLSKSKIFRSQVIPILSQSTIDFTKLQQISNEVGDSSGTRITIILPNGQVIADSENEPLIMDNHKFRKEMRDALDNKIGISIRYSKTLQRPMMYLAVPLTDNDNIIGVLRLSVTTKSLDDALNSILLRLSIAFVLVTLFSTLIAFVISKRISKPLEEMKIVAEKLALGEFDNSLPIPDSEEIAQLAEAMNYMAKELDERINIITRQSNEQKAILQSMVEGVIAIDDSDNIIIMNKAAGELFGVDSEKSKRKSAYEVIRNPELQDILSNRKKYEGKFEGELILNNSKIKNISYSGSALKGTSGNTIGSLIVLNDITHLRHLEKVRQDFVANVSHELRTPITSIKGFVETLADGAIDNKEDAKRFLEIIDKQVNRLNAIISDLLSLANIEESNKSNNLSMYNESIFDLINGAVEVCKKKSEINNNTIIVECDNNLTAKLNAPLVEQALVNLIDNAIKYSPSGEIIIVEAFKRDTIIELSVIDKGVGIHHKHFPRLFERFYVVDKARSRELGGTGLGLAIVKHISQANSGSVRVESELGKGSKFTILIPRNI